MTADRTTGPWPAWRSDGVSAARQAVRLRLAGSRLVVSSYPEDQELETLDARRLRLAEEVYRGQPPRLVHPDRPDLRYTVADPFLVERLAELAPGVRRRNCSGRPLWLRLGLWAGLGAGLLGGLFAAVPLAAGPVARLLPESWLRAAGEQVVAAITAGDQICEEPRGAAALGALVERLGVPDLSARVQVVDSPVSNALAAPGGQVVLFQGLVDLAAGPEEVAGVLAHELAHVALRHPTEGLVRQLGHRMLIAALIGDAGGAVEVLGGAGELLIASAYSRADESEADRMAVEMLNRAGLDSTGLASLLQRLQEQHGAEPPRLLASHPLTDDRVADLRAIHQPGAAPLDSDQWQALRRICQ